MIKVITNAFLNFTILLILINEKCPNPVSSNDTFDMTVPVPLWEIQAACACW